MGDSSCNVRVVVRFRPINDREKKEGESRNFKVQIHDECRVELSDNPPFTFDRAFAPGSPQDVVYEYTAKQTILDVMNGYNGTIFAFGQTGSGKTFTMFGPDEIVCEDDKGIVPRASSHLFEMIRNDSREIQYSIKASFLEIYKENIRDLLQPSGSNLPVRESPTKGVYVEHLSEEYVSSEEDIADLIKQGETSRSVASTKMNARSSRSHSLFIITVEQKNLADDSVKIGRLNLIDLAGSEKVGKTGATGNTLEEAKKINQSLSALGNCIHALTESKRGHVPYRDSKLTRILQESLGGNTKTTLVITASPHVFNAEETLGSLRFGARAKTIQNQVTQNVKRSVEELMAIINALKSELIRMKKYCVKLENHIHSVQDGDLDPSAPLPKAPARGSSEEEPKSAKSVPAASTSGSSTVVSITDTTTSATTNGSKKAPVRSNSASKLSGAIKQSPAASKTTKTTKTSSNANTPTRRAPTTSTATKSAATSRTTKSTSRTPTRTQTQSNASKSRTPNKTTQTRTKATTRTPTKPTASTPTRSTTKTSRPTTASNNTPTKLNTRTRKTEQAIDLQDYDPLAMVEKQLNKAKEDEKISFQLEQKQEIIEQLEEKLESRKNRILDITDKLKELQTNFIAKEEDAKRAHHLLITKDSEIVSLKDHFGKLTEKLSKQLEATKQSFGDLETSLDNQCSEIEELKKIKEKLKKENQTLQDLQEEHETQISALQKSVAILTKQVEEAATKIEEMEEKLEDSERKENFTKEICEKKTSEVSLLKVQLADAKKHLMDVNNSQRETILKLEALRKQKSNISSSGATVEEHADTSSQELIDLYAKFDQLALDHEELNEKLIVVEENLVARDTALNSSIQNCKKLQKNLETLQHESKRQESDIQQKDEEIANAKKFQKKSAAEINALGETVSSQQLRINQLEKALIKQKKLLETSQNEWAAQQADMAAVTASLELNNTIARLESDLEDSETQHKATKQSLETSETEKKELQRKLEETHKSLEEALARRSRVFRPISAATNRAKPMEVKIDYTEVRSQLRSTNSPFLKNLP